MNSPSPHLSDEELARYYSRSLQAAELLAADKHVAQCDVCHRRLSQRHDLTETLLVAGRAFDRAASGDVLHLTFEQLTALVDDELTDIDREIAESHLEGCRRCEAELGDLRELSSRMPAPAQRRFRPASNSIAARLASLWQAPVFRFPVQIAAALAAIAVSGYLLTIPLRKEVTQLQAKVGELEQNNAALRNEAGSLESLQAEVAQLHRENDELRQAAGGNGAVVAINDGGARITLDRLGNLTGLDAAAPAYQQMAKEALERQRVRLPAWLGDLRGKSGTLMSPNSEDEFSLMAPVGIVLQTDRPTFKWAALDRATSYTVTVFNSSLNRVTASEPLTATEWTPPGPLPRGVTYIWHVRAIKGGKEVLAPPPAAARAKFQILERSKVEGLERARKAHPDSHLILGLLYADAGLLSEADQELSALQRANPNSPAARKLLSSVRRLSK